MALFEAPHVPREIIIHNTWRFVIEQSDRFGESLRFAWFYSRNSYVCARVIDEDLIAGRGL